ncbi:MAG: LCP family protein [Candidatus Gracilibacteria bacterium]|nr:LCP family protein [Candidatus Gracilibacteria bacterium]
MNFKKTKIIKKQNNLINIIGIVSICMIFIIALVMIKNINIIQIKIDEQNILKENQEKENQEKSLLEKILLGKKDKEIENNEQDENNLNILVVGRGGGNHDAPDLTDTIILTKINTKDKIISMLSIPRDLYVKYPGNDNYYGRINGIYSRYMHQKQSDSYGMEMLEKKISEITGEKIDHYINIDFNGFKEIIDTIGGINIEIPENFVDYQYPDGNGSYKTLVFKKGIWLFDGENALKYVRSRHSTSDFDRSLRQQKVINAIKEKLTAGYFFSSPMKIKELYDVFNKNVKTDIGLSKILKLAYAVSSKDDFELNSSNMNDTCFYYSDSCQKGGILYVPNRDLFGGMSILLINGTDLGKLSNYEESIKYSNIIFNYSLIEREKADINIFNSLKVNNLALPLANDFKKYGFIIPDENSIGNTGVEYEKTTIYYNNISKNSDTIKALKTFFNGEFIETQLPKYSKNSAKIEVVIGKDYLVEKNIFKF